MALDEPLRTSLYDWHKANGGRLVEFGGWSMPVQYSTIVNEHQAVRNRLGLFDIGHMGRLRFDGPDAQDWIEAVTTNHVAKLVPGQIQYSLTVADDGGILDDILVYRTPDGLAVVCNASNRAKVVAQFEANKGTRNATLRDETLATGMIAVQGPKALDVLQTLTPSPLVGVKYYYCLNAEVAGVPALVSRTGYTGEDGFEVVVPANKAEAVWTALLEAGASQGILPCGLGARDTLRFDAAMPLYGHEMDETVNPYEAGLGWAVKLAKGDFVGREALQRLKGQVTRTRVGLLLDGKRIARQGAAVLRDETPIGTVTSGTFSPTLNKAAAMALVPLDAAQAGTTLALDVRGQSEPATVVPLPFYKRPAAHPAS